MLNTLVTLPLDVASSKQVLGKKEEPTGEEENKKMGTLLQDFEQESPFELFRDSYSELQEEKKDENVPRCTERLQSSSESLDVQEAFQNYSGLWKGLAPALLLCSNPSINYTVFDMTKNRILTRQHREGSTLSMSEAFLVGLFAKFIATVATYPLIRAKVILMVTSENSLIATLCRTYREDGVRGLYKGCDWQLIHAVLKSALMMMVREKITLSTQRIIVGETKK
jgi:hypothetical protein